MMPDLFVILLFAIPIGVIFCAGAIVVVLMLVNAASTAIADIKSNLRNRQ